MNTIQLNQEVLSDNHEIHGAIIREIQNAQSSIKVASAWFTDQEILDALISKQKEGVSVSILIADNKDNEKLNFNPIERNGGSFYR